MKIKVRKNKKRGREEEGRIRIKIFKETYLEKYFKGNKKQEEK